MQKQDWIYFDPEARFVKKALKSAQSIQNIVQKMHPNFIKYIFLKGTPAVYSVHEVHRKVSLA